MPSSHQRYADWTPERIDSEIRYYADANLNLIYFEDIPNPPEPFLDLCDRYGLLFGNVQLFLVQCMLVVVTVVFAAAMTWTIFKLVDALMCVRVAKTEEIVGLDLTQHSESAYTLID